MEKLSDGPNTRQRHLETTTNNNITFPLNKLISTFFYIINFGLPGALLKMLSYLFQIGPYLFLWEAVLPT